MSGYEAVYNQNTGMKSTRRTFTAALLTMAKTMALAASLAMAMVLSRLLSKSDYGAFRQVILLYAICSIVLRVGVPQSIYYFLPRLNSPQQRGFILQSVVLLLLQGGLFSFGLYFGADVIGGVWQSDVLPSLLRAFAPYPALILPVLAAENVLMTFHRVKTVVLFNILAKVAAFVVVVTPVYLGQSMVLAIHGWVILAGIEFVIAVRLMLLPIKGKGMEFSWKYIVDQHKYAFPFSVAAVLGVLGLYADKLIISTFGGPEVFAVYSNGAFELPVVGVISAAVTMTILPPMVQYAKEGKSDRFLNLWHRSQTKVAFVLFPFLGLLIFFASETIQLLFSRRYAESAIIFQIFLCLVPARICSFASVMVPLRKNWFYAFAHFLQLVIAYASCFLLYNRFGMTGVAIGLVLSVYMNTAFMGFGMGRFMGIGFRQIWSFKKLAINLAIAFACGLAAYLVCWFIPSDTYALKGTRLALGTCVYGGLYLLLTSRMGLFKWREWHQALRPGPPTVELSQIGSPNQADESYSEL